MFLLLHPNTVRMTFEVILLCGGSYCSQQGRQQDAALVLYGTVAASVVEYKQTVDGIEVVFYILEAQGLWYIEHIEEWK